MSAPDTLPSARHEPTDGLPRVVAFTGGGIAAGLALVLLAAAWVTHARSHRAENLHGTPGAFLFENGPQATTGVAQDWIAQDRAVHEHLQTYGWIDRGTGVVRVPIERAMELLAGESVAGSPAVRKEVAP